MEQVDNVTRQNSQLNTKERELKVLQGNLFSILSGNLSFFGNVFVQFNIALLKM